MSRLSHLQGHTETLLGNVFEVTGGKSLKTAKKKVHKKFKALGRTDYKILLLPDVKTFAIKLGMMSALLLAFGIVKRMTNEISIERYRNGKFNKYILHIYNSSLAHLQNGNQRKFWALWLTVVRRSNVYMILCLHLIDKNLYKTKTLREIENILKRVNKLRRKLKSDLEFRRVYIPKASSGSFAESDRHTFRPLGVPSLPWRIYLNMLEHVLVLSVQLNESQHGFRPNRGTLTAWKSMFSDVIDSENIYEIDLRQCFPSISLLRLHHVMTKQYGVPYRVGLFFLRLNYATPEFKGELRCNETQSLLLRDFRYNAKLWKKWLKHNPYIVQPSDRSRFEEDGDALVKLVNERSLERLGIDPTILRNVFISWATHPRIQKDAVKDLASFLRGSPPISRLVTSKIEFLQYIGTIQGSPLSPYLSAIALSEIEKHLPKGVSVIMYADDMIFYGPNLRSWLEKQDQVDAGWLMLEDDPNRLKDVLGKLGFTMHVEKSGWVKKNGIVLKPDLKFLGMN